MPVRVKICGITNFADAATAVDCGADALGFIFFEGSPRFVQPKQVRPIISKLPPFVVKVGVFVNEKAEKIKEIVDETGLSAIQLHGSEPPEFAECFSIPTIQAFRIKDQTSLAGIERYRVAAVLLDSYVAGSLGGTGERFNWDLAVQAKALGKPVILAGGLTPLNVQDAAAKVQPYAVDVSSGVEAAPGVKDHTKVREFIARAKSL
jgi:phosphoribosylanthranilate isomerase